MNEVQRRVAAIQKSAMTDPRFKQNQEVSVTSEDADYINKLFNSILPHFPAWRQTCPTDSDLQRLKMAWSKAFKRYIASGKKLNIKAGLIACEESDTDWLPSVGKFIKWCEQSNDLEQFAKRALDLFNSAQKQIDSVGKLVVSKHSFELKQMKASDTNKKFIELYLRYAENNAIEPLESNLLTETVQLSADQQKDADKRALEAQNQFLNQFSSLIEDKPETKQVDCESGLKTGSTKVYSKTVSDKQKEKERQLKIARGKL